MELVPCDLCGNAEFSMVARSDRYRRPLETAICTDCGLIRHAVVPTDEELDRFYSVTYRPDYKGQRIPGARRIMRAWNNGLRICRQVSPLLEKGSHILDVGTGIGCAVKIFDQAGFIAEGIDPGAEFLEFSRERLKASVRVAGLYDLEQQQNYNAVLLVHVIEHLRSPRRALQHIAGLIRPGGLLYVECPNLQAPFARRSKLFHKAHIHNFVPSTLTMLAQSCGFRLRMRFGDEWDSNLQMLFQHTGENHMRVDADNYERTLCDLSRAGLVRYHCRVRYLTEYCARVATLAREHLQARRFVERLTAECTAEWPHEVRRAA